MRELDERVEQLYSLARAGKCDVWRPSRVACAIFGPHAIALVPHQAQLGRLVGRRIYVRAGLPTQIEEWIIGHELGHYALSLTGREGLEAECDYIGAAIQMRRSIFAARMREVRHDFRTLAIDFATTQTSAAMRVGEISNRPIAVLTPTRVYTRGELAGMAAEHVRRLSAAPDVRKTELTDAPHRTALDASRHLRGKSSNPD